MLAWALQTWLVPKFWFFFLHVIFFFFFCARGWEWIDAAKAGGTDLRFCIIESFGKVTWGAGKINRVGNNERSCSHDKKIKNHLAWKGFAQLAMSHYQYQGKVDTISIGSWVHVNHVFATWSIFCFPFLLVTEMGKKGPSSDKTSRSMNRTEFQG